MASEHALRPGDDRPLTKEKCKKRSEPDSRSNDNKSERNRADADFSNSLYVSSQTTNGLQRSSDGGESDDNAARSKENRIVGEVSHSPASFPVVSSRDRSEKEECFRMLVDDALKKIVVAAIASSSNAPSHEEIEQNGRQSSSGVREEGEFIYIRNRNQGRSSDLSNCNGSIMQHLVQEKHTTCLLLQQTIDSKDSEIAQLETLVDNLRESKKQEAANVNHLRVALRNACENAASARNEANKAEANGLALTTKIESFERAFQETKRASVLLLQEQEEIGFGVEGMENEFIQLQAKLVGQSESKLKMKRQNQKLSRQILHLKDRMNELEDELETEHNEHLSLKRKDQDLEEIATLREGQRQRLQAELDSVQELLVDSTSAAAESKDSLKGCKQAIDRLEEANQHLHQQLQKYQATSRKQEASNQDELNFAKKEHQAMKLQLSNQKEKYRSLKLEKLAADKRQEGQAAKIFALERRLKDSTNLMTTAAPISSQSRGELDVNSSTDCSNTEEDSSRDVAGNMKEQHCPSKTIGAFAVPRLGGVEKPQFPGAVKKCSICFKDSGGLMKKCECPRKDCQFRAHATCVQQRLLGTISGTSHLDSDAQHLLQAPPVILCRSATTRRTMKRKASEETNNA